MKSIVISQNKNDYAKIKVSYGVEIKIDKQSEIYKIFEKFTPGISQRKKEVASEIDFTMLVNNVTSFFYLNKKYLRFKYAPKPLILFFPI